MEIERGVAGGIPYAATGSGKAVLVCAGLWPTTGVGSDRLVSGALVPLRALARTRRLIVVNRRPHLPAGLTMRELAAEYADAIRTQMGGPVDVVGNSTGGSIAQQLAADHPDTVRRLVLLSTACRLRAEDREQHRRAAALLRAGRLREAAASMAGQLAPRGLSGLAQAAGWASAHRVVADRTTAADLAATLEAEAAFDLAACPQPIRAKTLIVAGGRDRFYGHDLVAATAALIPGSLLREFPSRGHISVGSDPRVQATIAGFLDHA